MQGAILLDNSIGAEIHGDGTVGLIFLVETGFHSASWDDLSIRECMCWKKDHTYTKVVN